MQCQELDKKIAILSEDYNSLSTKVEYKKNAFVTYEDMAQLAASQEYKNYKLLVISAKAGAEMEVPEPAEVEKFLQEAKKEGKDFEMEDKKHMIYLKSPAEEIKIYTVENEEESEKEVSLKHSKESSEEEIEEEEESEGLCKLFGVQLQFCFTFSLIKVQCHAYNYSTINKPRSLQQLINKQRWVEDAASQRETKKLKQRQEPQMRRVRQVKVTMISKMWSKGQKRPLTIFPLPLNGSKYGCMQAITPKYRTKEICWGAFNLRNEMTC
eukprot:TRINITY_DN1179_c0_g2_i6.p2 TRINITY_DN1179_c0_g2~~TRINITY_DN1179_c0_g2_i6.p2  ORF type:complete len:268 (+),score=30.28 TRINITY_DN1179_c0_g2_i6:707-1510(+)